MGLLVMWDTVNKGPPGMPPNNNPPNVYKVGNGIFRALRMREMLLSFCSCKSRVLTRTGEKSFRGKGVNPLEVNGVFKRAEWQTGNGSGGQS